MKYIVHICEKGQKDMHGNPRSLGWTEMYITNPKVGDVISLSYPSSFLKMNKWFGHIPSSPYTIIEVTTPEEMKENYGSICVNYSGELDINLKSIRDARYK